MSDTEVKNEIKEELISMYITARRLAAIPECDVFGYSDEKDDIKKFQTLLDAI